MEVAEIWDKFVDVDKNGSLFEMEWISSMKTLEIDTLNNNGLKKIFNAMDKDNDGYIAKQDFVLFATMTMDDGDELFTLQANLMESLINKHNMTK